MLTDTNTDSMNGVRTLFPDLEDHLLAPLARYHQGMTTWGADLIGVGDLADIDREAVDCVMQEAVEQYGLTLTGADRATLAAAAVVLARLIILADQEEA